MQPQPLRPGEQEGGRRICVRFSHPQCPVGAAGSRWCGLLPAVGAGQLVGRGITVGMASIPLAPGRRGMVKRETSGRDIV